MKSCFICLTKDFSYYTLSIHLCDTWTLLSIADSVSKRRRLKTMQEDTSGLDSSGGDSKVHENSSKKHSCEKCGRVFSKWKHLSIHYTKVECGCHEGKFRGRNQLWMFNKIPLAVLV